MDNNENKKENSFEAFNIFDEIKENGAKKEQNILEQTDIPQEQKKKSKIIVITNFLKIVNYIFLFFILFSGIYIFIQKSDIENNSYLNLFCPLLLGQKGDDFNSGNDCYSITAYSSIVENDLATIKKSQFDEVKTVAPDLFMLLSSNTKDKDFLLDETKNRLKFLDVLNNFESLVNNYNLVDKNKIKCSDLVMDGDNILKASCEAYSTEWDEIQLSSSDDNPVYGTSISVAISFLDYIENQSTQFSLIDRQKSFSQTTEVNGLYVYKTSFDIELKYNGDSLSF